MVRKRCKVDIESTCILYKLYEKINFVFFRNFYFGTYHYETVAKVWIMDLFLKEI